MPTPITTERQAEIRDAAFQNTAHGLGHTGDQIASNTQNYEALNTQRDNFQQGLRDSFKPEGS